MVGICGTLQKYRYALTLLNVEPDCKPTSGSNYFHQGNLGMDYLRYPGEVVPGQYRFTHNGYV